MNASASSETLRIDIERFIEGSLASAASEARGARGERFLPVDLSSWGRVSISDADVDVIGDDSPGSPSEDVPRIVAELAAAKAPLAADNVFFQRGAWTAAFGKPKRARARRPSRWPVVLCGLLAVGAAGAAVLTSPLAEKPAVQRVTSASRAAAAKVASSW